MRSLFQFGLRLCYVVVCHALLLAGSSQALAEADPTFSQMAWKLAFNITDAQLADPVWLEADADLDGMANGDEMAAGTDPFSMDSVVRVSSITKDGTGVHLSFPTVQGKLYVLQAADELAGGTGFLDVNPAVTLVGNASENTLTAPAVGAAKFYRVLVRDTDSDNDEVSDWAEVKMGTNPSQATTPTNASGGVAPDGETLRSLLSLTASAVTPDAYEKEGTPARVRLTRTYGTMPLALPMSFSGAALSTKGSASPTDYSLTGAQGTTAIIPNGAAMHDVVVNPVMDSVPEVPESLGITFLNPAFPAAPVLTTAEVKVKDAAPTSVNRRLYVAYLGREAGVTTTANGVATALVEGDNDVASVSLTFSNLSSAQNTAYIRTGDGLEVQRVPNGQVTGQSWSIRAAQILLTDQATLDALASGQLYVSVSSANFQGGEIRGTFQPATGSTADPPEPAAPPAYGSADFPNLAASGVNNNSELDRDIARFLMQASYGPTEESIVEVRNLIAANGNNAIAGYTAWINKQMSTAAADAPSPSLLKLVQAADMEEFLLRGNKPITYSNDPQFGGNSLQWSTGTRTWVAGSIHNNNYPFEGNRRREWWTLVLNSKDQLRQRMALALSEIVVISENDATVDTYHYGTANYWDMLAANAFSPYRTVLEKVTYSPLMGVYLSHLKNQKKSGSISPDENFAREIMQLFSIGLVQRHLDGSLKLDSITGLPIATYDQGDITELARVMTGLSFGRRHASISAPTYPSASSQSVGTEQDNTSFTQGGGHRYWQAPWLNDMRLFSAQHDFNDYTTYTGNALPSGVTSASKILFAGKTGQTVIPPRTVSDANGTADITDALNALAGTPGSGTYDGHPNTPVFISRLLIQRFTTANPSAGYLHRVATAFKNSNGNLGEVIKAILLDYEARTLPATANPTPADSTSHGKHKEPLLHFAAVLRGLKFSTSAPLANLNTMPIAFTAAESPVTTAYETAEYSKFPANTTRFRWFDTEGNIGQSPQRAPSVFNWFLPDYVVPGPLATAGLVAPELQIATESNVVNVINQHYNVLFTSIPPGTTVKPGYGLDNFFNLSGYQTAGGVQLSVPAYGQPYHATTNPNGKGYFSAAQFNHANGTDQPDTINNQLDNMLPGFTSLTNLYTATYNASLVDQYSPASVPASPGTTQKNVAHDAAAVAVLDQCDLLFTAGYLKAKYGSTAGSPRKVIMDALATGNIGSRTTHTDATNNGFLTNAQTRCKNIAYLVITSPQALVLK